MSTRHTDRRRHKGWQAVGVFILVALAALAITFGRFHRLHDSDSIVPVMMSLTRWTPFYWDQDRFGMLVPLLAIPVRSPLANLLTQTALDAFCGLAAFFLCARYVMDDGWLMAGALSAASFLLLSAPMMNFQYLGPAQPYAVGMFLGLSGLLVLRDTRLPRIWQIALTLVCLLFASWVDAAVVFVLVPVLVLRSWFNGANGGAQRSTANHIRNLAVDVGPAFILVCISFGANYIVSGVAARSAAYADWPYSPVSPSRWPLMWYQLAHSVWSDYLTGKWKIGMTSVLVLGCVLRLLFRPRMRDSGASATLFASAVLSFLLIGSLSHIEGTEFEPRFALQSLMLFQVGAITWGILPLQRFLAGRARTFVQAALLLVFVSTPFLVYGKPSLAKVRTDLSETLGQHTTAIIESGATHVIGNYWNVWPAVFHANLVLQEGGSGRKVWGVTTRSGPTQALWSAIPADKMRIVAIENDPEIESMLQTYSFPAVTEERRIEGIVIYRLVRP